MQPLEDKCKTYHADSLQKSAPDPATYIPDMVMDTTMQKYGTQLRQNIDVIRKRLNF